MISQEDVSSGASDGVLFPPSRHYSHILADCDHHRGILTDASAALISQSGLEPTFISTASCSRRPSITASSPRVSATQIRILFHQHFIIDPAFASFVDTLVTLWSHFCHFKAPLIGMFRLFHWTVPQRRDGHRERTKTCKQALRNH